MTGKKVFCIGLGKTGTTSVKEALRILGYRTIRLPLHWKGINDFDAALPGVSAAMYPELDDAYPGSKFILTVRDIEGWLKSIKRDMGRKQDVQRDRTDERVRLLEMLYGTSTFEEERFRQAFNDHQAQVHAYFESRPNDLLVLEVTRNPGWDDLCAFLEVPVPDLPFPFVNKASELDELLVRLLHVTRDIGVASKISKYSTAYLDNLAGSRDVDGYDMQGQVTLTDDRRINKILKRSSRYFGGVDKAATVLNIPESTIRLAIARQKQHARTKRGNRQTFRWLRTLISRR